MHQYLNYRGPRTRREKERLWENFWRDYSWKFPQHGKGNSQSSPRGTKSPIQDKPKEKHTKNILIKLTKTKYKERILKTAREKQQITYKGNPINLTADLSAETLKATREWQDIFQILKGKNLQPILLYTARISFKIDGEIKSFSDKQKLRIQYHQTSFTSNVKGNYIVMKYKRRKKIYKINCKQLRKWQ